MVTTFWCTGYAGHSFILRMYRDNAPFPGVEAPPSAFSGCACGDTPADRDGRCPGFSSARMMVAPGRGYISYREMPLFRHCRITVENRGASVQDLCCVISGWYGAIPAASVLFHAPYRQEHPVQKGRACTVLDNVRGRGLFAGLNGHSTCRVEGEARMYLDEETYLSMNHTGTEDCFGGSCGFGNDILLNRYPTYAGLFAIPGDTKEKYNTRQRFLLYRWHVLDPVYFQRSFRITLQNPGWTGPRYDDYTMVAFCCLQEPAPTPFPLPPDQEPVMT